MAKISWRGMSLSDLHFHIPVHHWGKAGTWRQELKQTSWRITAYWLAFQVLCSLLITQDQLCRDGTIHNKLDPSMYIINQENALQTYLQANLIETFSHPPRRPLCVSSWPKLLCTSKNMFLEMKVDICSHFLKDQDFWSIRIFVLHILISS